MTFVPYKGGAPALTDVAGGQAQAFSIAMLSAYPFVNRSLQHYAPHDYYPQRRTMVHVTVEGDMSIGVSGVYTPGAVAGNGMINPSGPPKKPPVRQFERVA